MKLGKLTTKLVREAMVLGFVEGYAQAGGHRQAVHFPHDRDIIIAVLRAARANPDLYPTLSTIDGDIPETEVMTWLRQQLAAGSESS